MLDIAAVYDGTGNTALTAMTTAATNDTHTVQNSGIVPRYTNNAITLAIQAIAISATDAPKDLQLQNQDLVDSQNYTEWKPAGTSIAVATPMVRLQLKSVNPRLISYAQKAAGAILGVQYDYYPDGPQSGKSQRGAYFMPNQSSYNVAAGGAITAGAWRNDLWAPTKLPQSGQYILLGAWGSAFTNGGIVGFEHADFGKLRPGFVVMDQFTVAPNLTTAGDELALHQGYQFAWLSQQLGVGCCPQFTINNTAGTGLTIYSTAANADTPTFTINVAKVG